MSRSALGFIAAMLLRPGVALSAETGLGQAVLKAAGVDSGLCVHLGCGDGALTARLAAGGRLLVHGLALDPARVAGARKLIDAQARGGQVTVDALAGPRLPHADDLANLVVAEDLPAVLGAGVTIEEVIRVARPGGVVLLGAGAMGEGELKAKVAAAARLGQPQSPVKDVQIVQAVGRAWARIVKPRPAAMGEWTHFLHGPDGNKVSADSVVTTPTGLRWIAGPEYPRGDRKGSTQSALLAGGRVFYHTLNERTNVTADQTEAGWHLIARDAFNGLFLWKHPWTARADNRAFYEYQRVPVPMACTSERVYAAAAPKSVSILDAAGGQVLATAALDSTPTEVVALADRFLVATDGGLYALAAETGRQLWKVPANPVDVVVGGGRAHFRDVSRRPFDVVAVDLATGKQAWRRGVGEWNQAGKGAGPVLKFFADGRLVFAWNKGVRAVSAEDGRDLWAHDSPGPADSGFMETYHRDGLIWLAPVFDNRGRSIYLWEGLDPASGAVRRKIESKTARGRYGCGSTVATPRFFITGKTVQFFDPATEAVTGVGAARGPCTLHPLPGNGLLYCHSQACACLGSAIRGNLALAASVDPWAKGAKPDPAGRLIKGPARGGNTEHGTASAEHGKVNPQSDWPTFRHDPGRSGCTAAAVPAELKVLWEARLSAPPAGPLAEDVALNPAFGDPVTAPVIAAGTAYVALPNTQQIAAVDAETGRLRWRYTAGGPIDSPPTIDGGLCVFGCRDGWVYCLAAADGQEVWRFRAAPLERRIPAFGRLESPWPVAGSVTVVGETAVVSAGRSMAADGGINVCALDVRTGRLLWEARPGGGKTAFRGMNNSVLAADGTGVFMGPCGFDLKTGAAAAAGAPHLAGRAFSLLASPWRRMPVSLHKAQQQWRYGTVEGFLLVVDEKGVFGYRGTSGHTGGRGWVPIGASELFALSKGQAGKAAAWSVPVVKPFQVEALVKAGEVLFAAGPLDRVKPAEAVLWALSAADGRRLAELRLPSPPVFDGLAAAGGRLYLSTQDGSLRCLAGR